MFDLNSQTDCFIAKQAPATALSAKIFQIHESCMWMKVLAIFLAKDEAYSAFNFFFQQGDTREDPKNSGKYNAFILC